MNGEFRIQAQVDNNAIQLGEVLNALEGMIILGAEPPLNRRGPNFGGAKHFGQFRDPDTVYPAQIDMIQDIWDEIVRDAEVEDEEG